MIIVLIKTPKEKYYIMLNQDNESIAGFTTIRKGLNFFERAYNRNHARSFEASMSACYNYMEFQPSVVEVKDVDEIKNKIASDPPYKVELSSIAGFMKAVTTRKGAKKYWEEGTHPELVKVKKR